MMDTVTLAHLRYPFPALANPHAAALQTHTNQEWIDNEWREYVPMDVAEKFKMVRTGYMTSYFYPSATWERLIPLARMMLFSLYQDDIYERAHPDYVRHVREGTVAVARGEITAADTDVMLAPQIERLRGELLRFLTPEGIARWATGLDRYFAGLITETTLITTGAYPSVAEYMVMRENALMLYPFVEIKEVETEVILPTEVHQHPTIKRLKALTVRLPGWFNEFQSYDKDVCTGMGNVNLINALAHEHGGTLEQAREQALGTHADELAEFVRLQQSLPDFGEWHDAVADYVHHLSFIISGWRGAASVIQRYDPEFYLDEKKLASIAQRSLS